MLENWLEIGNRKGKQSCLTQIPSQGVKEKLLHRFRNTHYYRQSHCSNFSLGLPVPLTSLLTLLRGVNKGMSKHSSRQRDSPRHADQHQEAIATARAWGSLLRSLSISALLTKPSLMSALLLYLLFSYPPVTLLHCCGFCPWYFTKLFSAC